MPAPNLINCLRHGRAKDLPELSLYGWALSVLDHDPSQWDEEAIHVSDYTYALGPSEGGCDRQLWHRLRQDERTGPSLQEQLMWDQGFAMQLRYTWLIENGLPDGWGVEAVEMDISEGLPSDHVGSCDLVLQGPDMIIGVEMKTQRGRSFRYLDESKESHETQAQGELYALQRLYPDMEVKQRIMYIDREGSNKPLVFPVRPDEERIEWAADYVSGIRQAKDRGSIVPDPLAPGIKVRENKGANSIYLEQPWPCSYCSFRPDSCPGALPDKATENGIVAKGDHEDPDALDWKVDGDLRSAVEQGVARAVQAGNVTMK